MRRRFERTRERDCGFYGTTSENNLNQDGYKQIKPEVEKPIEEIQAYWDNLFSKAIEPKVDNIEDLPDVFEEEDEIDALPALAE
jgi:hypothetical protein